MEVTLEQVAGQIADVSKQVSDQIADLSRQLSETKDEIHRHARVNMEEVKTEVKLAAEGYGASLESIERQLHDLNTKLDTKFDDHDLVLADHNRRIIKLEER